MQRPPGISLKRPQRRFSSFTLIEMLAVIVIIAILAALTLGVGTSLLNQSKRSRAKTELAGIGAALENYKVDNGTYPPANGLTGPPGASYPLDPTVTAGTYQTASAALFTALNGNQSSYSAAAVANATNRVYFLFKLSQVGSPTGTSYVQDPWLNSYGYSTGLGTNAYSGVGFFDLWSTAGSKTSTNGWVANWNNN